MTRIAFIVAPHAAVRNEHYLHREAIVAMLRIFPGCDQIKGLAMWSN